MASAQEKVPRIRERSPCPCGSGHDYGSCCRPYHIGEAKPSTAEQLMRSRYSAYFFRRVGYLVDTQHPDTRPEGLKKELSKDIEQYHWRKLTIVQTSKGQPSDKSGKVKFIAQFHHDGELHEMEEHSRFKKLKGVWKYLDGRG